MCVTTVEPPWTVKRWESGARFVRARENLNRLGCAKRAPRGLLISRPKREAFEARSGGHAFSVRRVGRSIGADSSRHLHSREGRFPGPIPVTLGFRFALSALLSFPADARTNHHSSPGAFGFPFSPKL